VNESQGVHDNGDSERLDVVAAIDSESSDQSKCGVSKEKCVAKKLGGLLKCHQKAQLPGKPTDPNTAGTQGVFSATNFLVPPPDCIPAGGNTHARSVSFKITKAGKASGAVKSTEDPAFTDCVAAVPVKIQRKTNSGWKTVGKATTTDAGKYTKKVKNPKGKQKFRALAPKVSLGDPVTDVCSKAKSATRKV